MLEFFTGKRGFTLIELERSKSSMNTLCSFRRAHYIRSSVRRNEGFTLIELLVVLAIVGLLISVLLVSFGPPRKEAKDTKRQTDIKQIGLAMDLCYTNADCGTGAYQYPANDTADKADAIENIDKDKNPCYLCPVPKDPSNSGDQMYKWSKNDTIPTKYCVYVKLQTEDIWIAASEKGTKFDLTTKPPTTLSSAVSCW